MPAPASIVALLVTVIVVSEWFALEKMSQLFDLMNRDPILSEEDEGLARALPLSIRSPL